MRSPASSHFWLSRAKAMLSLLCFGSAVLAGMCGATSAHAASPAKLTGTPIRAAIPAAGQTITVNLRELGVISGTAPVLANLDTVDVMVNGQQTRLLQAAVASSICIQLHNVNFSPTAGDTYSLVLDVSNALGKDGPREVAITNTAGPISTDPVACRDPAVPNVPPTATITGGSRTIADTNGAAGETVTLQGVGTDSDGTIQSYSWRDETGRQLGTTPTLGPLNLADGAHTFTLVVIDDQQATGTATATITVSPPIAPVARAGADQTIPDSDRRPGGERARLDGSASTGLGTLTYRWTEAGVAGVVIGTTPVVDLTGLTDGTRTYTLTVSNAAGLSSSDAVTVVVTPPVPLVANAGTNRTIADTDQVAGESVTLDGSASTPAGAITTYTWAEATAPLGTGRTLVHRFTDGAHIVTLTVSDGVQTATTNVTINVTASQPIAPTANAGPDQNLADTDGQAGENVTLNGGQSVPGTGTITAYQWSEGQTNLGTGATLATRLGNGTHTLTLTVTNSAQLTATDTVIVTVTAPALPPVANAGPDQTVADTDGQAGENVTLNGGQSAPGTGTITAYQWREGQTVLGNTAQLTTRLGNGVHTLTLAVTNSAQLTATDTVQITVVAQPNAPTANAGPDQNVVDTDQLPGESVTLNGGQSTAGTGTITIYQWREGEIVLGNTAQLTTRLDNGTHTITLTVTNSAQLSASDTVQVTVDAPASGPAANAGPDQSLADTDGQAGENVTLTGAQSTAGSGTIVAYRWSEGQTSLGTGPTLSTRLDNGTHTVTLTVTNSAQLTSSDTVVVTIAAPSQPPVANAGADQNVADTDQQPGENVTLNGNQSTAGSGTITAYQWREGESTLGASATLTTRLSNGVHTITLTVTNSAQLTSSDTVVITVNAAPVVAAPVANAGPDQTIADTDQLPGENVTLNGAASTGGSGTITAYQWSEGQTVLGTGATLTTKLATNGAHTITLTVTNSLQSTATDTVVVTVNAPPALPVASAGPDQDVQGSARNLGEIVALDGSASTDPDGTITSYQWFEGDKLIATGAKATVTLPAGPHVITLTVTDTNGNSARDTVTITVVVVGRATLEDIPNLTPNQKAMAAGLDAVCGRLANTDTTPIDTAATNGRVRPYDVRADRADLATKCNGLLSSESTADQIAALDALTPKDFAAARTQTLLFSNFVYTGVMDRLMALRGGARGLSLAGLDLTLDGSHVPLAQVEQMIRALRGGGASADEREAGDLLGDRWGLWLRGNYGFGKKETSIDAPAFDADQFAMLAGLDYHITNDFVLGLALAYGDSSIKFQPSGEGKLDTKTWALSAYSTAYAAKNLYFDLLLNVANGNYDADRNITYHDGLGLISAEAQGDTSGMTMSGGFAAGYDFLWGGLTVSPNVGAFYIDTTIDEFTETGAGGLNLTYEDQNYKSLSASVGLRMTYAWNLRWGTLLPHLRADYVREFEDNVEVFGVRFAADPNGSATPPILIRTENPDKSYWRFAAGFAMQFQHGISGYVDYQRLAGFQTITFQDISVGLRFQKGF